MSLEVTDKYLQEESALATFDGLYKHFIFQKPQKLMSVPPTYPSRPVLSLMSTRYTVTPERHFYFLRKPEVPLIAFPGPQPELLCGASMDLIWIQCP